MRVIVRSAPKQKPGDLCLLTPETSRWDDFGSNLVALIGTMRQHPGWHTHVVFRAFLQPRWDPRRSLTASVFCHAALVAILFNLAFFLHFAGADKPQTRFITSQRLEWYQMANQIPAVAPDGPQPVNSEQGGKRKAEPKRGATVLHPQTMVSNPANPDNSEQTIVQPDAPKIRINQNIPLPNIAMWNEVEKPAVPMEMVQRSLSSLKLPAELVRKQVDIPQDTPNLERKISDLKMASALSTHADPKLEVEPATTVAGNTPPTPDPPPPPTNAVLGSASDAEARLRKLLVVNANPTPPRGPIEVPEGNRAGSFSAGAGPSGGTPSGAGTTENAGVGGPARAGDGRNGGGKDAAGIHVPGISVTGGPGGVGGPVVSAPAAAKPAVKLNPNDLRAGLSRRPQMPPQNLPNIPQPEPGFQPGKHIYTVFINMPNLTSSGGGSWVLRFAELQLRLPSEQIEISAPVAVRKIDPGYSPDAFREGVQGIVKVHAIIRHTGHVDTVEVLHSLDDRLDQRAVDALQRWEFQPATRLGIPVDLEAVIEIPFKLPLPK